MSARCGRRALERGADDGGGSVKVVEHQLGGQPHDAVAGTLEVAVPPRVPPALRWRAVVAAVHFHDESARGSDEVHDRRRTWHSSLRS